ncbi:MAG TPA: CAP domain-containing protein [Pirellulales bacterium]|jgi:uncharacterized protein YkwD|nr:CAP domain-containing protein [Pirellulales bacterium]
MLSKFAIQTVFAVIGLFVSSSLAIALANDADLPAQSTQKQPASSQTDSAKSSAKSTDAGNVKIPKLYEVEQQMIQQTNSQRAKYGLPPLLVDQSLEKTARTHTIWMTNNRTLQHSTDNIGENIAMGQRTTDEAVSDWMASPGHRANILNTSYKRTGVAAYRTPDGTIYWCQQFLP